MNSHEQTTSGSGLSVNDVLFSLFRHKWKVLLSTTAGITAAASVCILYAPLYESQAKLLVRYVLDRSAIDPADARPATGPSSENLINSEVEILTSRDLALQVANVVGVERFFPGSEVGAANLAKAAGNVRLGLTATVSKGTNIIVVAYHNHDPELATGVLNELITRYFTRHLEIHRSAEAFDFLAKQSEQVQARLNQTESELKALKTKTKIVSLSGNAASLNAETSRCQAALHTAATERAEQQARLVALEKWLPSTTTSSPSTATALPAASGDVHRYQALVVAIARLRQTEIDLLARYTPENILVKLNQTQIEEVERQRRALEKSYPGLVATLPTTASARGPQFDLATEKARLAAIDAGIEALQFQLADSRRLSEEFSEVEPRIAELERRKELEEANYKYFAASLEKARVDEALDPSKMPNISVIQKPSTASRTTDSLTKIVLGLAGGGVALGVAWALSTELVFDRTVKRPLELETRLKIPLLASIPYDGGNGSIWFKSKRGNHKLSERLQARAQLNQVTSDVSYFIRPFAQSIRDRITLYFELRQLKHQPKLIAVTSCSEGAGTSTLAAGLATAFSETGDGKVLLVDMNVGRPAIHPFFDGKRACTLAEALQAGGGGEPVVSNLTLATGASNGAETSSVAPKKFYDLIPRFKASDFSYIIFDMPALGEQTSTTLAMAGFMDKVLLVIEAEKCDRHLIKRAYGELTAAKAHVSAVLNKRRYYGPKWLAEAV